MEVGAILVIPHVQPKVSASSGAVAYDVPADKMWAAVSSWSGIWITEENSPAAVKDLKGEGVGATRTVFMRDGSGQWKEKVTAFDAAGMSWSYKATSPLPEPFAGVDITKFICTMSVESKGKGCEVTISSNESVAEELGPMLSGMYKAWTASMAEAASK